MTEAITVDNLKDITVGWGEYRKITTTKIRRMETPFTVQTQHGLVHCANGYLAVDSGGWPYPIAADEFEKIYEGVPAHVKATLDAPRKREVFDTDFLKEMDKALPYFYKENGLEEEATVLEKIAVFDARNGGSSVLSVEETGEAYDRMLLTSLEMNWYDYIHKVGKKYPPCAMAEMFAKGAWKDRGCCAHRTGYMPRWECRREGIMHRCTKGECLRTNPAAVGLVARYEYDPDYAVPPGETLAEVIEDRGMTQHDLAIAMCLTDEYIVEIIAGEQSITQDIATGLETVTGVSARMWMALEKQYRELL